MKQSKISPVGKSEGAQVDGRPNFPHRILTVDKDNNFRRLYAEALARPGFHVDTAADGAAAWEALQANHYSLLITELNVPRLSGGELVRKMRAARMAMPVVLAAERLPTYDLVRHSPLQLEATLLKPFAIEVLVTMVKKILSTPDGVREQTGPRPNWRSQPSAAEPQF